jgi:ribonucleoside-diphosphate reductase alpha chain
MKLSDNAVEILKARYLPRDEEGNLLETPEQMIERVAQVVASAEKLYDNPDDDILSWQEQFRQIMTDLDFLPNLPALINAGRPLGNLAACFAIDVGDSMEEIFKAVRDCSIIFKTGGGLGLSFSRLRPKGAYIQSSGGQSSGPVSFMEVFDATTGVIKQGSFRRGASLGLLRIDHPDIVEFVTCKDDLTKFTNFNISVAITDDFIKAVEEDRDQPLIAPHTGKIAGHIKARKLFDLIVNMAWKSGEPGIVFIDEINRHNPTPHIAPITTVNACLAKGTLMHDGDRLVRIEDSSAQTFRSWCSGIKQCIELVLSDGKQLVLTPDHIVVLANGAELPAIETLGSELKCAHATDGAHCPVVRDIRDAGKHEVYDFRMHDQSFPYNYANGILCHNCGEQPLLPLESCTLGSINLSNLVQDRPYPQINYDRLRYLVHTAVRFLDNVIDVNRYPLPEIEEATKRTRKIGLGIMGLADMFIKMGIPYNSDHALTLAEKVMRFIQEESHRASQQLAKERGPFPCYSGSVWDKDGSLPMRNATTTTIAPTGSISLLAGCSAGIEPIFAIAYTRKVVDYKEIAEVHPLFHKIALERGFYSPRLIEECAKSSSIQHIVQIPEDVRRLFLTSHDISPEWHVRMQAIIQKYTDNAASKTINLPRSASPDNIKEIILLAHNLGCKGITVYRDGSRSDQTISTADSYRRYGPIAPRPRPQVTTGFTKKHVTGCGNLFVTLNSDEIGPCEVFTNTGRKGGCPSQSEATARLVSMALRAGITIEAIVEQLKGIRCLSTVAQKRGNGLEVLSCPDAIARVMEEIIQTAAGSTAPLDSKRPCPDCGEQLESAGGCVICRACGYSKCG